jgi:hypothetical protein
VTIELQIPCSPEQLDVIADHLVDGAELGMQPDERVWIISQVRKQYPTAKVVHADLDLGDGEWTVKIVT